MFRQSMFDFEKVPMVGAREKLDGPLHPDASPGGVLDLLESPRATVIPEETRAWLNQLPAAVRPMELVTHYARIAKRFAEIWHNAAQSERYFAELMLNDDDRRRQGFPPAVMLELATLQAYLMELHPEPEISTWRDANGNQHF